MNPEPNNWWIAGQALLILAAPYGLVHQNIQDKIFIRLLAEIENTDGKVGFASMTIHMVAMPTMDVRLRKEDHS